jgi:hypothetical protein
METYIDYLAGGFDSIGVALLTVDFLLQTREEASVLSYYSLLRAGTPWEAAFWQAFETAPVAFYAAFEEYRRSGFERP